MPVVEIVPFAAAPPITPSTDHFTPTFVVPVTDGVNCLVVFSVTLTVVGEMVTTTCACTYDAPITPTHNPTQSAVRGRRRENHSAKSAIPARVNMRKRLDLVC